MRAIMAQAKKELIQLRRDPITLIFALIMPPIIMLLIGAAISLKIDSLPAVVADYDRTPLSRRFIDHLSNAISLRVTATLAPVKTINGSAIIIIPENFARDIERGRKVNI